MASITTQVDTVRSAVASTQTCTPTISATLKDLLQGANPEPSTSRAPSRSRTADSIQTARKTRTTSKQTSRTTSQNARHKTDDNGGLSAKEKAVLATQVINATLKALGDAAKHHSTQVEAPCAPMPCQLVKSATRNALRRSNSMPMSPLQPRSLNRVATSPIVNRASRSPSTSTASSGCLATVECARVAFSTLRTLSNAGKIVLPELQVELGMSSFVNKLLGLHLYEHALKELRVLKRRLEGIVAGSSHKRGKTATGAEATAISKTLSDLFDYPSVHVNGPALTLVINTQLQALRVVYGLKKSSHVDDALQFLRSSHQSSPLSLLLHSLEDKQADQTKCARQLETLAQSLLSLTPSVSSRDDGIAVEPRLSPSPETSLEIQSIGLTTRLHSWSLSGHNGDVDREILHPLEKCLGAYLRRSSSAATSKLESTNVAFDQVWQRIQVQGLRPVESSHSSLASIYQLLGMIAKEASNIDEAIKWIKKLKRLTNPNGASAARCCCVTAQLLALSLKRSSQVEEGLIAELLEDLQGSLNGNTTELDELLGSICQLRKVAVSIVLGREQSTDTPQPICELLEGFILQLPRFALRWLGKPPANGAQTKDFLRFEQRRQLLSTYLHHILDSALMLTMLLLEKHKLSWDVMDPVLQDTLTVLEHMGDQSMKTKNNPAASYYVKISHFYYQQHIYLRNQSSGNQDLLHLRALRRSIASVSNRSEAEQAKSQLLMKQERLADLCKTLGRRDDAADALRSARDTLVREDVLADVKAALSTESFSKAWQLNDKTLALSRTVCNLAKLEQQPCDWTWLLAGDDKFIAMEHDLYFVYSQDSRNHKYLAPGSQVVDKLLQAFPVDMYPVRRLRTLLQLLSVDLDDRVEVSVWMDEAIALAENINIENLIQDSGLARYVPHFKALTSCVLELFESSPDADSVRQAIATWKAITTTCDSEDALYDRVDNPAQLVTVLQSLADFARLRGLESLLVDILEVTAAICRLSSATDSGSLVRQNATLCLQYLALGHSLKAQKILMDSQEVVSQLELSNPAVTQLRLCSAEYNMTLGDFDQAEQHLAEAQIAATTASEKLSGSKRLERKASIAYAYLLHAILALHRGSSHYALQNAKNAVRVLFHYWSKLENSKVPTHEPTDETSHVETSADESSLNNPQSNPSEVECRSAGPELWIIAYPLFRSTLELSSIYAHIGLYQETMYYAEQAEKIARGTGSTSYLAQSNAWMARAFLTAGQIEKAVDLASEVLVYLAQLEPTCSTVDMACQLSRVFRAANNHEKESKLLKMAEKMLQGLRGDTTGTVERLGAKMDQLTINEEAPSKKPVRQTRAKATKTRAKRATKKATTTVMKSPAEVRSPTPVEDMQLSFMRASILQQQSVSLLEQKEWPEAVAALQAALEMSKMPTDMAQERFSMATALIGQSLEQMGQDSVFSVIQDSTLSFPAIAASLKDRALTDRASPLKSPSAKKGRAASPTTPNFLDTLQQARDCLLEAHSAATISGNSGLVQRIAAVLQSAFILLSTTNRSKFTGLGHPAHATCSIELARNLVWRRERKTLRLDHGTATDSEWPMLTQTPESRRSSLGFSIDMNRFQREYIDIIPESWRVVSVSLSDNQHDLCITKLEAGRSPFAIRLPLERASSRDADTDVFDFQEGRAELLRIIKLANRTCHDARDMSVKGAKSAWWTEREALDQRMKDLLENIEQTWLGGFRGIFSQHQRRTDLLARFQKSFQNILDKYLPSRRQIRGKRAKAPTNSKVSLDPRILDLFIGLGDATAPSCDFDEPLTDLLYFVVDILQFHGERNAYDEVDFDSMVVETFDALHSYHAAAKNSRDGKGGSHTILVLDKALHIFPWESLPCMEGSAVSRIPSLACLRRSILEQRRPQSDAKDETDEDESVTNNTAEGHHISINSGTYILNPGADLKNTQNTFGAPLASLPPAWTSIETRAPSESEFEKALTSTDLLLYFGHGSGAQYIRGRTVRKMEKCRATALLMGCSSASLADPGEFECHGPVWNYMLAGSPAVVGTLWDVTDRDIDRFAGRLFEEWCLMPRGTFKEDKKGKGVSGRGRKKAVTVEENEDGEEGEASLVEAVTRSRSVCRFRYLTAAAVVVYGIPVYIEK